jgi:hypothetical protein
MNRISFNLHWSALVFGGRNMLKLHILNFSLLLLFKFALFLRLFNVLTDGAFVLCQIIERDQCDESCTIN